MGRPNPEQIRFQNADGLVDCCDHYDTMIVSVVSLNVTYLGSQCCSVDHSFMNSSDVNRCCVSYSMCVPKMGITGTL